MTAAGLLAVPKANHHHKEGHQQEDKEQIAEAEEKGQAEVPLPERPGRPSEQPEEVHRKGDEADVEAGQSPLLLSRRRRKRKHHIARRNC